MPDWTLLAFIAGIVALYAIRLYHRLATLRHNVDQAWADIDVLLKQRYEQIPVLVELCRRSMSHEVEALSEVTRLREQADAARANADARSLSGREQALTASLSALLVRAEATPDLKAAEAFTQMVARLSELCEALSAGRKRYNEAVSLNNRRRQHFPEMLLASLFGFAPRAPFEMEAAARGAGSTPSPCR